MISEDKYGQNETFCSDIESHTNDSIYTEIEAEVTIMRKNRKMRQEAINNMHLLGCKL